MAKFGLAVPILPGKEDLATKFSIEEIRRRMAEYEQSRRHAGITMERVYLQRNPDGSNLLVVYIEAAGALADVTRAFAASESEFDRWFFEVNQEISGFDFRQPPPGGGPEHLASWEDTTAGRGTGLAFAAPVLPGQTEAGRAWAREAFQARREELTESRRALGQTREEVFLNTTPEGDVVVIYLEGEDPVRANRQFAASGAPYDRWFKDSLKELLPPFIDFDQPVPANETLWDWSQH
jgi:Family of unknown function (DUF6176)